MYNDTILKEGALKFELLNALYEPKFDAVNPIR